MALSHFKNKNLILTLLISVFLFAAFTILFSSSASAGRTCCHDNNPNDCSGCGSTETKNCGDAGDGIKCCGYFNTATSCCLGNECNPPPPPPPPCVPTYPNAVTLNTPFNNASININSTTLAWNATNSWGTNCEGGHKYNVFLSESTNCSTATFFQQASLDESKVTNALNNLNWGSSYCWYIEAHNGSYSAKSETRKFTINQTPVVLFHGFTQPNTCTLSTGISGRADNPTGESENPITYTMTFQDPDSNDTFFSSYLVFVPVAGGFGSNIDPATDESALYQKSVNSNAIAVRITAAGSVSTLTNAYSWSGGVNSGETTNQKDTATVMGIGSDTKMTISGNTATANFKIKMKNTFPSGNYNVYAMVLMQNVSGGVTSYFSSYSTSADSIVYKKLDSWFFDMQNPGSELVGPTYNTDRTFNVNWRATDSETAVASIYSYIWSDQATGAQLTDQTIPTTINLANTELSYHYPTDLSRHDPSNAGVSTANLGIHKYKTTGVDSGYSYKIVARDSACNISEATLAAAEPSPWLMSYKGNTSAQQGYQVYIPDNPTFKPPFNAADVGTPYLSTYEVISGDTKVPTLRISKTATYALNYTNDAVAPTAASGAGDWYDLISERVEKNGKSKIIVSPIGNVVIGSDVKFSNFITASAGVSVTPGLKIVYKVPGNLAIGPGQGCDVQAIILVGGNLIISADFKNSDLSQYACMFVVKENMEVLNAGAKPPVSIASGAQPNYDILDGYFIVEKTLKISTNNNPGDTNKYQGLYVDGGIYSADLNIRRDLNYTANLTDPGVDVFFNPAYRLIFAKDLSSRDYSIREVF